MSAVLRGLKIKIFADGADKASILSLSAEPHVQGLTTNPTLMRKAGILNYRSFAREVLAEVRGKPICFEVLADDFSDMERQALEIAAWGENVYVKIPVTNTQRQNSSALVKRLAARGVKLNVTAIMTLAQVRGVLQALDPSTPSYISVFAGRIADTGMDPVPVMQAAVALLAANPKAELVWASCREIINIFQADAIGCQVITVTSDILKKIALIGYDLDDYSLDTVRMFHDDARAAGFTL
jgi:transaldolase